MDSQPAIISTTSSESVEGTICQSLGRKLWLIDNQKASDAPNHHPRIYLRTRCQKKVSLNSLFSN